MSALLDNLRQLQDVDREILRYRRYQRELPLEVEQKHRELKEIDRALDARRAARKDAMNKVHREEGEIRSTEDKVKKLQSQSMEVKTNREYKAILNEIANHDAEKSKIEDRILELYASVEGIDAEIGDVEARRKAKEKEVDAAKKRSDEDLKDLDAKIAALDSQRTGHAGRIPAETLALYEGLLEDKDGLALAAVVGGVCQGCSFKLLPNVLNRLSEDTDLVKCSHCGRFLYEK